MTSIPLSLDAACLAIVDCEHKTSPIDPTGSHFAVGTPAMRGNRIDYSQARRISEDTFRQWTRRLSPRHGDLLFAREAPVGPVVCLPKELNVAPGQRTVLLRPDPEQLDSRFLYYLLTSPREQARLLEKAEGSTVPHLNVAEVRAFELPPLPTLEEQKGIAAALGSIDDKIESNRAALQIGEALIRAEFDTLALQAAGVNLRLGEVVSESRTKVAKSNEGTPVVLSAVATGHLRRSDEFFNKQVYSKSIGNYLVVRPGDLAYNPSRANIGSIGINDLKVTGAVSPVYIVATLKDRWREWIRVALTTPNVVDQIRVLSSGSVRQVLRFADFASIGTPRPPDGALDAFNAAALSWGERAGSLEAETRKLSALRDTLLPELLSGRIRVPELVEAAV